MKNENDQMKTGNVKCVDAMQEPADPVRRKPQSFQERDALFESKEPVGQCSVEEIRAIYEAMLNDNRLLRLNSTLAP